MFSADKLAQVMRERKMTASDLSRAAGVSHQYVQQLLRGSIRLPRQPYMDKLTEALGVSEAELMDYPQKESTDGENITEAELFHQLFLRFGRPGDDPNEFRRWFEVYLQNPEGRRKAALELLDWHPEERHKGKADQQAQQG